VPPTKYTQLLVICKHFQPSLFFASKVVLFTWHFVYPQKNGFVRSRRLRRLEICERGEFGEREGAMLREPYLWLGQLT
jgi:hypothetical protein